jgi:outer membrane assembly lipoprotein YfiO
MSTYPDSELASDATLAIGDSYYDEGGTENLLLAEDSYKNFIVFFPTNPKAADAYMKMISLNYKMMRSPDRDQTYSFKTLKVINEFLAQYPDSDFAPIAKQIRQDVEENLAAGSFGIGLFYEKDKDNPVGAAQRYQEILKEYPGYSKADEVLFHLGDIQEKSKNLEEAAINYSKIVSGYPFSKYVEQAKTQLKSMGKPIPEVDTQTAAANQARVKPEEGFNLLKPIIDFGKALGIAPPPDLYKQALKSRDEEKAKAEGALAAAATVEGKSGSDIQIEQVIRKNAAGDTQETTILNPSSSADEASPSAPAKEKDAKKKKEANKYRKNAKKNPVSSQ